MQPYAIHVTHRAAVQIQRLFCLVAGETVPQHWMVLLWNLSLAPDRKLVVPPIGRNDFRRRLEPIERLHGMTHAAYGFRPSPE